VSLDPLAAMAQTDSKALRELMASVTLSSDELMAELERVAQRGDGVSGRTDPDAVPPVPKEPISRPGDLWGLGAHRLLCGDATEASSYERLGAPAHLIFTDPPYGISYRDTGAGTWDEHKLALRRAGLLKPRFEPMAGDDLRGEELFAFLVAAFTGMAAASAPTAAWYVWHAVQTQSIYEQALGEAGYLVRNQVVWAKSRPAFNFAQYKYQHEPCFYAFRSGQAPAWYGDKAQTTLWEVPSEAGAVYRHPTQKPVGLADRAIANSSLPGDVVLDPFLGSGSTLIAAEMAGRRCFGLELEPRYVDVAVRRWEQFTGQSAERV
jgi:DNA modification methylase